MAVEQLICALAATHWRAVKGVLPGKIMYKSQNLINKHYKHGIMHAIY